MAKENKKLLSCLRSKRNNNITLNKIIKDLEYIQSVMYCLSVEGGLKLLRELINTLGRTKNEKTIKN